MKSIKWKKFRVSKNQFPTVQIDGEGNRKGALVVGSKKAKEYLEAQLGISLAKAICKGNSHEWVFKFPIDQVPKRGE